MATTAVPKSVWRDKDPQRSLRSRLLASTKLLQIFSFSSLPAWASTNHCKHERSARLHGVPVSQKLALKVQCNCWDTGQYKWFLNCPCSCFPVKVIINLYKFSMGVVMLKVRWDTYTCGLFTPKNDPHFCYDGGHIYHSINQQGQDLFLIWSQQIGMAYKTRAKFIFAVQHYKKSAEKAMRFVIKRNPGRELIAAVISVSIITWLWGPKIIIFACFLVLLQLLIAIKLHFKLENIIWFQNLA